MGRRHNSCIRIYAARTGYALNCLSQLVQRSVEVWFGEHLGAQPIAERQGVAKSSPVSS